MKIRHVIDESGLRLDGLSAEDIADVVDEFIDRMNVAKQRGEQLLRSSVDIWDAPVTDEINFYDLLYGEDGDPPTLDLDRIQRRRLRIAIDRVVGSWDEDPELLELISSLEVTIAGGDIIAPSLALAYACRSLPRVVGCLNFKSSGRSGIADVQVEGGQIHGLHFVMDERSHVQMFRDAVDIEDMNRALFEENADSAFPRLHWVTGVWRGLGKFSRPYLEHREALVRHLSVLNDATAQIFHEFSAKSPDEIIGNLGGQGVNVSGENGRTMSDATARKDRTREFRGQDHVFWWHTKLLRNTDRIHFKWLRNDNYPPGEIVVGIFVDHCHLPG